MSPDRRIIWAKIDHYYSSSCADLSVEIDRKADLWEVAVTVEHTAEFCTMERGIDNPPSTLPSGAWVVPDDPDADTSSPYVLALQLDEPVPRQRRGGAEPTVDRHEYSLSTRLTAFRRELRPRFSAGHCPTGSQPAGVAVARAIHRLRRSPAGRPLSPCHSVIHHSRQGLRRGDGDGTADVGAGVPEPCSRRPRPRCVTAGVPGHPKGLR